MTKWCVRWTGWCWTGCCVLIAVVLGSGSGAAESGAAESWAEESVRLEPLGRFDTGVFDGGAAEVIAYHAGSRTLYSVNTNDNEIDIVSLANPAEPLRQGLVKLEAYGEVPTSVSARQDIVAASVLSRGGRDPGKVVFFTPAGTILGAVQVGWHPDMVMFTPDGKYLVVANEGEPTPDNKTDGEGSVSLISVPTTVSAGLAGVQVREVNFRPWNNRALPPGVRVVNRQIPFSQDAEPEGIAISTDSRTAFVSLQENNAIAVIDIGQARVTRLFGLQTKDHMQPGNELDLSGQADPDRLRPCPVRGMFQPDNVAYLETQGQSYLALADEGDARGNDTFEEGVFLKDARLDPERFPQAVKWQSEQAYGNVLVSATGDTDGDGDLDELLTFGTRSFSIVTTDGRCVYDSGSLIERLIVERLARERRLHPDQPTSYRTKKGPEPEGLAVGRVNGRTYVFVGLERDNGIVTFDVTVPEKTRIVDYCNPADFTGRDPDLSHDIGPEGLVFIAAEQSPVETPLLAVSNEVSGTISVYAVRPQTTLKTAER